MSAEMGFIIGLFAGIALVLLIQKHSRKQHGGEIYGKKN